MSMKSAILIPAVGESVTTATIEKWEKSQGDYVQKGEVLLLIETDKASMEIPSPVDGVLTITKEGGDVSVGQEVGYVKKGAKDLSSDSKSSQEHTLKEKEESVQKIKRSENVNSPSLSPSVRREVKKQGLDPNQIKGSGPKGRILKSDLLQTNSSSFTVTSSLSQKSNDIREPMSRLRKRTAEKLVYSQQSTATLSTFNEIDMSNIISMRKQHQDTFVKKYGVKLGFMSLFVKAVTKSLKKYPRLHARIDGEDIVYSQGCHIGIAISTDKGLVVPVVRQAETLSFAEIEKQIIDYGKKANSGKLSLDDLTGGTFTISNGGIFGSLLSTPILNPPQSGILGMHTIQERPVVRGSQVVIRPMMYVALSYDHRIVDGKESVGFLVKVKELLEDPAKMLFD